MDKDVIRIVIFAIGLAVIIGMVAWSYLQHEKLKQNYGDYGDDEFPDQEHSELGYDEDDYEPQELDGLDSCSHSAGVPEKQQTEAGLSADNFATQAAPTLKMPNIVQFSIVAPNEEGFNGTQLFEVLDDVGLEYGNLQIFERLDARRLVDFGVASMVKPGIFPSINLAAFHTPGIVFFMQPGKLDNPLAVFDDFVRTFQYVASQLGGEMWDHQREPLAEETLAQIRHALSH